MTAQAPTSTTDIVNMALDWVSETTVADIDNPQTVNERIMARHYHQCRRKLLREYVWNFAKRRTTCARTGTPEFDYGDKFQLPNDFIRLLSVNGDSEVRQTKDYDIEGREILLTGDANSINIRYIADVTDVTLFDPLFVDILVLTLALRVAYKFSGKKSLVEQINGLLATELPKAVSIDGQERPPTRIQRSRYINARQGGYFRNYHAGMYTVAD